MPLNRPPGPNVGFPPPSGDPKSDSWNRATYDALLALPQLSIFSGTMPSNVTANPGALAHSVASSATVAPLWVKNAGVQSVNGWIPLDNPGRVDVRSYGAVIDGVTDDGPAINAALSAASGLAQTVYLPPGTVGIQESLVVPANTRLVGDGARTSYISCGSGVTVCAIRDAGNATGVQLENFRLDANNHDISGISLGYTPGADNGLNLFGWLKNIDVRNCGQIGVSLDVNAADCEDVWVHSCNTGWSIDVGTVARLTRCASELNKQCDLFIDARDVELHGFHIETDESLTTAPIVLKGQGTTFFGLTVSLASNVGAICRIESDGAGTMMYGTRINTDAATGDYTNFVEDLASNIVIPKADVDSGRFGTYLQKPTPSYLGGFTEVRGELQVSGQSIYMSSDRSHKLSLVRSDNSLYWGDTLLA